MARSDMLPKASKFLTLASICIVVAALYLAREVLIPLALAMLLTFVLAPIVARLERLGLKRFLAVSIAVLCSFVLIGLIGWIVAGQLRDLAARLPSYKNVITHKAQSMQGTVASMLRARHTLHELTVEATSQPAAAPTTRPAPLGTADNPTAVSIVANSTESGDNILTIFEQTIGYLAPLGLALVVLVFAIFMLTGREDLRDRMIRLAGSGQLTVTTQAIDEAAQRVSRYLLNQLIVNGSYAVVVAIGLMIIGVPNPLLCGLICGILRFIPYVGIFVGAGIPVLLSMVLPGWMRPLATLCMFLVLELTVANFIEPLLYGASTGVSGIAILVAAIFWTWLWGVVGLLLSTPLTVCLVVMGKYVPHLEFLNVLLGDEPVLKPYERFYQRLLAADKTEALALIREMFKTHDAQYMYENVLLPAMGMARRDSSQGNLDQDIFEAVCNHFREVVAEIHKLMTEKAEAAAAAKAVNNADVPRLRHKLPNNCMVNVVCVAAHDEPDAIGAAMLSELLTDRGYCVQVLGAGPLASEVVAAVEQTQAHVVVISAFPPRMIASARYLVKKLHQRFPDLRIVVGAWNFRGDLSRLRPRIGRRPAVEIVTDFSQAQDRIEQIIQPVLLGNKVQASESMPAKK